MRSSLIYWLTLLRIIASSSVRVATNDMSFSFLITEWYSLVYMYYLFLIYEAFRLLPYLGYYNQCCWKQECRFPFKLVFLCFLNRYLRVELLDHMLNPLFNLLRILLTSFHVVWISLHSHQQCNRVPFFLYPPRFLSLNMGAILTGISSWFWFAFP